jgi:glutathione S-transferase
MLAPLHACLQGQPYFGGATPCATDRAVFPFVRQFAAVEPAWFAGLELPALQAWLSGWLASSLFTACMRKLPPRVVTRFVDQPK